MTSLTKNLSYKATGTIFERQETNNPGPNHYTTENHLATCGNHTQSGKFTMGKRYPGDKPNANPAPNAYTGALEQLIKTHDKSSKFSIKEKTIPHIFEQEIKLRGKEVGPGKYNVEPRSSSVSFSMESRHSEVNHEVTPAPNAYNAGENKLKLSQKSAAFSMKNSKKFTEELIKKNKDIPGPSHYKAERSSIDDSLKKSFTKDKRTTFLTNKNPGPGAYDNDISKFNKTKKRSPSSSFGSRYSVGNHF